MILFVNLATTEAFSYCGNKEAISYTSKTLEKSVTTHATNIISCFKEKEGKAELAKNGIDKHKKAKSSCER